MCFVLCVLASAVVCVLINGFQAAVLNQTNTTTMGTLLKSTNGTNGKKLALCKNEMKLNFCSLFV